jgi:hypothetical protein
MERLLMQELKIIVGVRLEMFHRTFPTLVALRNNYPSINKMITVPPNLRGILIIVVMIEGAAGLSTPQSLSHLKIIKKSI